MNTKVQDLTHDLPTLIAKAERAERKHKDDKRIDTEAQKAINEAKVRLAQATADLQSLELQKQKHADALKAVDTATAAVTEAQTRKTRAAEELAETKAALANVQADLTRARQIYTELEAAYQQHLHDQQSGDAKASHKRAHKAQKAAPKHMKAAAKKSGKNLPKTGDSFVAGAFDLIAFAGAGLLGASRFAAKRNKQDN